MTRHNTTSTKSQTARLGHRLLAMVLATLGLVLMFGAGSASAIVIRSEVGAFGTDGTAASSFGNPRTLALNQVTGELYAADATASGIFGFDVSSPPAHSLLGGFSPLATAAADGLPGLAVDDTALPSAGNIYFASESTGQVYGFDSSGAPLGGNFPIDPAITPGAPQGSPKDICGAAVDSAGNLWIANFFTRSILKYSSAGVYQGSINTTSQSFFPCAIAFDSNDDMYVTNGGDGSNATYKYTAVSGYAVATLVGGKSSRSNAVDKSTHDVFLIEGGNTVAEYDSSGNAISTASEKDSTGAVVIPTANGIAGAQFRSLAIDSANDLLYVSDETQRKIRVFGPALTYPDLTPGTASGIENTSATVDGTISAQGLPLSDCHFEYVSEVAFGNTGFSDLSSGGSAPCGPSAGSIPADSATHPVSAVLGGLTTNSGYRFRLVAANASGSIATLSDSFETTGRPLVETTGSPVRTTTIARLDSRVSPSRAPATYHFEYGEQGPCDSNPCTATDPHAIGGVDEVQRITIKAIAGQFKLTFGADTTTDIPFNASAGQVEAALVALASIAPGDVVVSGGPGDASGLSPYSVRFTGAFSGKDVAQLTASDGTTPLSGESSATAITTTPGGPAAKEVQAITIKAVAGQFKLTFGGDTTVDLSFNASAAEVGSALGALPSIGAGNVAVSGGPGDAGGSSPYVVTFEGALANKNVAQLDVVSGTVPLAGNKGATTATMTSGGPGNVFTLVSQQIEGLQPNTTYHYRVIADNGNPDGPAIGEDMTVTTRGDEAPLSHGQLPGPVGSDRAWELVSAPDTSGNPVGASFAPGADTISDSGDRAVYGVAGGTPDSESGTASTRLFAQRTPSGWKTKKIYAPRDEATGSEWTSPGGPSDLSTMVTENNPGTGFGEFSFWRLSPDSPPTKLFSAPDETTARGGFLAASEDASRVLVTLIGSQDPEHPVGPPVEPNASSPENLYDISSGSPRLVGLLPDGTVPACGVIQGANSSGLPADGTTNRSSHWITADGSLAFFPSRDHQSNTCMGSQRTYMRDFDTETTKSISSPVVSGPECDASFIKAIPGAAFFYTVSRLVAEDREPSICGVSDGDIYRYDLGDGSLDCVTCVVPGLDAGVIPENGAAIGGRIGIANDGSRIYFTSRHRLLPGAPTGEGIYRLNVASGELAYLGSFGFLGEYGKSVMSPDGSVVVFSSMDASLNALGGQQNGETSQYYRYDDNDRSLICISCPADGSAPKGGTGVDVLAGEGANLTPLSADGGIFAFSTATALVSADQNTAGPGQNPHIGTDVYEWREGRLLLVSDGLTKWPNKSGETPEVSGITPSGHDIFFVAAARYTQDALDGYRRLYDARIGGGFEFPPKPKPCPLEVCQGIPKGAPEEAAPGTASITGLGNSKRTGRIVCAKPKRKVRKAGKTRCVKPKPAHKKANPRRANHERRTQR